MPPSRHDQALRRLVADLAAQSSEDRSAVLERLTPSRRETVESLLHEFEGPGRADDIAAHAHWLKQRLFEGRQRQEMTERASQALEDCLRRASPPIALAPSPPGKSLVARLLSFCFPNGAAA